MSQFDSRSGRQGPSQPGAAETTVETDEPQAPRSRYLERFGINAGWVEEVEAQYRIDDHSVDASWSSEFGGVVDPRAIREELRRAAPAQRSLPPVAAAGPSAAVAPAFDVSPSARVQAPPAGPTSAGPASLAPPMAAFDPAAPEGESTRVASNAMLLHTADKYARVLRLIHAYRARGHRIAQFDPLGAHSTYFPELDPAHYGFGNDDLDQLFIAGDLPGGSVQTLRQILSRLPSRADWR